MIKIGSGCYHYCRIFQKYYFFKKDGNDFKLTKFPKHVDYFCYTPEEFDNIKESSTVIENALENHIEVIL